MRAAYPVGRSPLLSAADRRCGSFARPDFVPTIDSEDTQREPTPSVRDVVSGSVRTPSRLWNSRIFEVFQGFFAQEFNAILAEKKPQKLPHGGSPWRTYKLVRPLLHDAIFMGRDIYACIVYAF